MIERVKKPFFNHERSLQRYPHFSFSKMSSSSNDRPSTTTPRNAYDAFSSVDAMVSKPVMGSDGAASWQQFQQQQKGTFSSVRSSSSAPKAPLKKTDRAAGFTSWDDERRTEQQIRQQSGHAELHAGYTTFRTKDDDKGVSKKEQKRIKQRIRPDDKDYFIPSKTFQGWKHDYIFTTRENHGTGYFWDGMDSYKQLLSGQTSGTSTNDIDNNEKNGTAPLSNTTSTTRTTSSEDPTDNRPKKKKRKKIKAAGPVIVENPDNPLEQVAAILQKRQQGTSTGPPLPAGWQATWDAASQKTYYFCRETGQRQWERPTASNETAKTDDATSLPEGWSTATDTASGKTYYYNAKTGETKWERP